MLNSAWRNQIFLSKFFESIPITRKLDIFSPPTFCSNICTKPYFWVRIFFCTGTTRLGQIALIWSLHCWFFSQRKVRYLFLISLSNHLKPDYDYFFLYFAPIRWHASDIGKILWAVFVPGKSVSGVRNITFLSYQIHQCTAHARSAGGLDGRVLMDKDSDPFAQLSEDVCLLAHRPRFLEDPNQPIAAAQEECFCGHSFNSWMEITIPMLMFMMGDVTWACVCVRVGMPWYLWLNKQRICQNVFSFALCLSLLSTMQRIKTRLRIPKSWAQHTTLQLFDIPINHHKICLSASGTGPHHRPRRFRHTFSSGVLPPLCGPKPARHLDQHPGLFRSPKALPPPPVGGVVQCTS